MRYIDDMRIYAYEIKPGWTWSDTGWVYNSDKKQQENNIVKTCEEFCRTFNSIVDFLEFTSESQCDFETGYLPTLDMQTKVLDNGYVEYKFFSKPSSNNLVLENGSAMPRNIVFGSLRQEIIRRLQNTSSVLCQDTKNGLIEDMIQLMINSNHKFSFIKSVVLQGITKYGYMEYRASLPENHPQYMPLHRPFDYRRNERMLTKYVDKMCWFKREKLGDPFKNAWKSRIKFKWSKRVSGTEKIKRKLNKREKYSGVAPVNKRQDLLHSSRQDLLHSSNTGEQENRVGQELKKDISTAPRIEVIST